MTEPIFALPHNLQSKSKLVQLPDEILTKVLRYLMKSDEPVRALEAYKDNSQGTDQLRDAKLCLSSQVLRCSQTLLSLGYQILYGENTVDVFHAWTADGRFCILLNRAIPLPPWEKPFSSLEGVSAVENKYISRPSTNCQYARTIIRRFQQAHFILDENTLRSTAHILRWFRSLDIQDSLKVTFSCKHSSDIYLDQRIQIVAGWLRCKEVTFLGFANERSREAVHTVQSGTEIVDVIVLMNELRSFTTDFRDPINFPLWAILRSRTPTQLDFQGIQRLNHLAEFLELITAYRIHVSRHASAKRIKQKVKVVRCKELSVIHSVELERKSEMKDNVLDDKSLIRKLQERRLREAASRRKRHIAAICRMQDKYLQVLRWIDSLKAKYGEVPHGS